MKATIVFGNKLTDVLENTLDILRDSNNECCITQYKLVESLYNAERLDNVKTYVDGRCKVSFIFSGDKGEIVITGSRALLNDGDMSECMEIVKALCEFNGYIVPLYKTMTPELLPYETIDSYCKRTMVYPEQLQQFHENIRFRYECVGEMLSALFKIIDGDTHESIMREFIQCYRYNDWIFRVAKNVVDISEEDINVPHPWSSDHANSILSKNIHVCHKVLDYLTR